MDNEAPTPDHSELLAGLDLAGLRELEKQVGAELDAKLLLGLPGQMRDILAANSATSWLDVEQIQSITFGAVCVPGGHVFVGSDATVKLVFGNEFRLDFDGDAELADVLQVLDEGFERGYGYGADCQSYAKVDLLTNAVEFADPSSSEAAQQ